MGNLGGSLVVACQGANPSATLAAFQACLACRACLALVAFQACRASLAAASVAVLKADVERCAALAPMAVAGPIVAPALAVAQALPPEMRTSTR